MKNILIFITIVIVALVGCKRTTPKTAFVWTPIDPAFDSIIEHIEYCRFEMMDIANHIDALREQYCHLDKTNLMNMRDANLNCYFALQTILMLWNNIRH